MVRFTALFLFLFAGFAYSLSPAEEKQLLRNIAEIKATLKAFIRETDRRFEQVDKRISELREDMNEHFRQIDKRFEQANNELNRLVNIMVGIFAGQIALVVAVMGFKTKKTPPSGGVLETVQVGLEVVPESERDVSIGTLGCTSCIIILNAVN